MNDIVGLEAVSQSFRIAKTILKVHKEVEVIILNPGILLQFTNP
ncbi:hypothetical protein LEP1GSC133_2420 [Leptospira borgpetersenii serovar Pomona str. 200901868]|uniref:Uncharacterized protein n=1 Tax=Leptospira borgpetersenii serovar Pomona str. 200901868 TaxID=1192866 RepID=M6WJI5_LEPBO|nr:hypothetical protein LEP1GSC133_2420 [Leptospira borgpetersenii serovar Pomona str. 200901868]